MFSINSFEKASRNRTNNAWGYRLVVYRILTVFESSLTSDRDGDLLVDHLIVALTSTYVHSTIVDLGVGDDQCALIFIDALREDSVQFEPSGGQRYLYGAANY